MLDANMATECKHVSMNKISTQTNYLLKFSCFNELTNSVQMI